MDAHDPPSFTAWVDEQLALEERARVSDSDGPQFAVHLTEIEAVGLLLIAVDAHLHPGGGPIGPRTARRLARILRHRLDKSATD